MVQPPPLPTQLVHQGKSLADLRNSAVFLTRTGLEWNQPVLANPRQSISFLATCEYEFVVSVIQQDSGKACRRLIDRDWREVTAFGERDSLRRLAGQLKHRGEALGSRRLKAIEHRIPGIAGLTVFVAARLDEAPEQFSERRSMPRELSRTLLSRFPLSARIRPISASCNTPIAAAKGRPGPRSAAR